MEAGSHKLKASFGFDRVSVLVFPTVTSIANLQLVQFALNCYQILDSLKLLEKVIHRQLRHGRAYSRVSFVSVNLKSSRVIMLIRAHAGN